MEKEQLKQITEELWNFLNNKGVGFICYVWGKDGKYGSGCQSVDADIGDAMVAISRTIKHFNIKPDALAIALREVKLEMEGN